MIEGFDKEIDAILRKARGGESVTLNNSHLDADEISAFAENTLPEKSKTLYTKHLADCDRCRRILSNIILLNPEDETVPVFVAAEEKSFAVNIPWYRRLFAFPGLAYSLGALVLVFGGLIGFIALQSGDRQLSQMNDKPFETKSSSVANATNNTTATSNTTMPTNSMTANTAANTNTASVYSTNTVTNSTANTTVSNSPVNKPQVSTKERAQEAPTTQNEVALSQVQTTPTTEDAEKSKDEASNITTRRLPNPVKKVERDDENKTDNNADSAGGETQKSSKVLSPNSSGTTTETINVSGKTFNRRNNVWIDSKYKGQSTTNITRGTEDYKKLDSDLRQTVERLGGTVVIVWKAKAYKIQ